MKLDDEDLIDIGNIDPKSYESIEGILSKKPVKAGKISSIIIGIIMILLCNIFLIKIPDYINIPFEGTIQMSVNTSDSLYLLLKFSNKGITQNMTTTFAQRNLIDFTITNHTKIFTGQIKQIREVGDSSFLEVVYFPYEEIINMHNKTNKHLQGILKYKARSESLLNKLINSHLKDK